MFFICEFMPYKMSGASKMHLRVKPLSGHETDPSSNVMELRCTGGSRRASLGSEYLWQLISAWSFAAASPDLLHQGCPKQVYQIIISIEDQSCIKCPTTSLPSTSQPAQRQWPLRSRPSARPASAGTHPPPLPSTSHAGMPPSGASPLRAAPRQSHSAPQHRLRPPSSCAAGTTQAHPRPPSHAAPPPSPLPAPSAWQQRARAPPGTPDQPDGADGADGPAAPTTAALNPRVSPTTGSPLHVSITPRAARRLRQLMRADRAPGLALRVAVASGGCHGFQYGVSVDSAARLDADEDTLFVYGRPRGEAPLGEGVPKVVMDRASLELLDGSSVDYTTELIGSQFKIVDNPRAVSSCGCGTSFDVKTLDRASPWG